MTHKASRAVGLVIAIGLGRLLFLQTGNSWTNYWLMRDGKVGVARVTKELWSGHNGVGYEYAVNQKVYDGRSVRNSQDERYSRVKIGEDSIVFYSESHPWLSRLDMPTTVIDGLPVLVLALIFESFALITVFLPKSPWAFSSDLHLKNAVE